MASTGNKFVIAVHGIGDQVQYETVQTVATQFCRYFHIPPAIPLGQIHSALQETGSSGDDLHKHGIYLLPNPAGAQDHPRVGFSEAFWADIPREVVANGYILEETKRWSRTIVERVQRKKDGGAVRLPEKDYETIKRVLKEMIETVGVLEWLSFLAEKAGLFKFRLNKLLNDFAGDVQIVTEYEAYRDRILARFDEAMNRAYEADKSAELYVIGHSEGTVVSFLGLLRAIRHQGEEQYAWLEQVRGFMTIGSPIEKHLVLWEDLMGEYAGMKRSDAAPARKIRWCNYYDHGDPVGSKLDLAWEWLETRGIRHFELDKKCDLGFSRYIFPGKAHTDYWQDQEVFGHFIGSAMGLHPPAKGGSAKEQKKPESSWLAVVVTSTIPYVLMFGLLFIATHVLYGFLTKNLDWGETNAGQFRNTFAVAVLLAGLTVLARVPRLTKELPLKVLSAVIGLCSIAVFYRYATEQATNNLEALSNFMLYLLHIDYSSTLLGFQATTLGMSAAVLFVAGATYLASELRPLWGLTPLIVIGGTAALVMETLIIVTNTGNLRAFADLQVLSQFALSGAFFLYLWWLAALLFDLVFIWHSYIRTEKILSR